MVKHPENLILIALTGVWLLLLARAAVNSVRRRRLAFASGPMLPRIVGHPATARPIIKAVLGAVALLLAMFALSRPTGGIVEEAVIGQGLDVVVALDVSKSMEARDIEGNSRLEVAKALLARMVNGLKQDRIGLIVFAGDTMVQAPLTYDKSSFLTFLERVDSGLLNKPGTDLAGAIETALGRFDMTASQSRAIILVSDGEDPDKERLDRAIKHAVRRQVPIFAVGIGSLEGAPIPEGRDAWGRVIYKTWQGQRVVTKLEDATLRRIAAETGGTYMRALNIATAREVAAALEGLKRVAVVSGTQAVERELFQLPLLVAFLLLLGEWMLSERIPYVREKDHWLKRF
jgi:Ca-activated chloride channel homolog